MPEQDLQHPHRLTCDCGSQDLEAVARRKADLDKEKSRMNANPALKKEFEAEVRCSWSRTGAVIGSRCTRVVMMGCSEPHKGAVFGSPCTQMFWL